MKTENLKLLDRYLLPTKNYSHLTPHGLLIGSEFVNKPYEFTFELTKNGKLNRIEVEFELKYKKKTYPLKFYHYNLHHVEKYCLDKMGRSIGRHIPLYVFDKNFLFKADEYYQHRKFSYQKSNSNVLFEFEYCEYITDTGKEKFLIKQRDIMLGNIIITEGIADVLDYYTEKHQNPPIAPKHFIEVIEYDPSIQTILENQYVDKLSSIFR